MMCHGTGSSEQAFNIPNPTSHIGPVARGDRAVADVMPFMAQIQACHVVCVDTGCGPGDGWGGGHLRPTSLAPAVVVLAPPVDSLAGAVIALLKAASPGRHRRWRVRWLPASERCNAHCNSRKRVRFAGVGHGRAPRRCGASIRRIRDNIVTPRFTGDELVWGHDDNAQDQKPKVKAKPDRLKSSRIRSMSASKTHIHGVTYGNENVWFAAGKSLVALQSKQLSTPTWMPVASGHGLRQQYL